MTSKLSWIAFIPFTLAAMAIKVVQVLFLPDGGTFLGFNNLMLSYLAVACAILVLLFAVIFCLVDKKIAPVYVINRNIASGITGILLAVVLACDGADKAFSVVRDMNYSFFPIADALLTVLCAVVFVVLGLNHFVGNGGVNGLAVFYLVPALFGAFRLVSSFLEFTSVSILVTDITELACYIFLTLFLFNYAMIVALMQGKSPVKSAFIYGMPAVTLLLSYSLSVMLNIFYYQSSAFDLFDAVSVFEPLLFGIYILIFVVELTSYVKRNEEIEFVEDNPSDEYNNLKGPDSEFIETLSDSVNFGNDPDAPVEGIDRVGFNNEHLAIDDEVFIEVAQLSLDNKPDDEEDLDTSDFIYGSMPSEDDFIMPVETEDSEYEKPDDDIADLLITKEDTTYDVEFDEEDEEISAEDKLDKIDKLILEITQDELG